MGNNILAKEIKISALDIFKKLINQINCFNCLQYFVAQNENICCYCVASDIALSSAKQLSVVPHHSRCTMHLCILSTNKTFLWYKCSVDLKNLSMHPCVLDTQYNNESVAPHTDEQRMHKNNKTPAYFGFLEINVK